MCICQGSLYFCKTLHLLCRCAHKSPYVVKYSHYPSSPALQMLTSPHTQITTTLRVIHYLFLPSRISSRQKCFIWEHNRQSNRSTFFTIYFHISQICCIKPTQSKLLLQLLLGAQVVGVSTLLLAAVDSAGVETSIAPKTQQVRTQDNWINMKALTD